MNPVFRWMCWSVLCFSVVPPSGTALRAADLAEVRLRPNGLSNAVSGFETSRVFRLEWDTVPGAVYRLERREAFVPGAPWAVREILRATGTVESVEVESEAGLDPSAFFRVQLPRPEVFSVEPAVASTGGGSEVFVLGQCLGAEIEVRVGGLVLPANTLEAGFLYSFVAPALPEGVYDVEVLVGGRVTAAAAKVLTVVGQPAPVGEAISRRLEPPSQPPASPWTPVEAPREKAKRKSMRSTSDDLVTSVAATGELQVRETDLVVAGRGLDFAFTRTYRSRGGRETALGANWDHSYNLAIEAEGNDIAVRDGTGRRDLFFQQPDGTFSRNEFFCEGRFDDVSGLFILQFPDGGIWEFHPPNLEGRGGRIARIADRNGNAIEFDYDVQDRLDTVTDTLGRQIQFGYDEGNRLTTVTDFTGRTVRYEYYTGGPGETGAAGDLLAVTSPPVTGTPNGNDFPAGKRTVYTYSTGWADDRLNHNLLSITDPAGETWLEVGYQRTEDPVSIDFDAVAYTVRGGARTDLWRGRVVPTVVNGFVVTRCIENDGVGNVTECGFDSLNRPVILREFTGRADPGLPTTPMENRPMKRLRDVDPVFFETRWSWNPDSLCSRVTSPHPLTGRAEGIILSCFYERDFDPGAGPRKKGDARVLREVACCGGADSDGDGETDTFELVWRFEHDPRFGSPPDLWGRTGSPGHKYVDTLTLKGSGAGGGGGGGAGQKNWLPGNFKLEIKGMPASRLVDPRGAVTVATYDAAGNLTRVETTERKSGSIILCDFNYTAFGQPAAYDYPADDAGGRRRDEFFYYEAGPQAGYLEMVVADAGPGGLRATNRFEYDALGRLVREVDPRGFDTLWTWNALDQLMARQTPKTDFGTVFRYGTGFIYDASDNLVQMEVENRGATGELDGENPHWTTVQQFDPLGRVTLAAHEAAHVVQQGGGVHSRYLTNRFGYDANDHVIRHDLPAAMEGIDPDNVVTFEYDERNLLFRETRAPGTEISSADEYDYDGLGRLTVHRHGIGSLLLPGVEPPAVTTFGYDGFGRWTTTRDPKGNVTLMGHDRNGNVVFEAIEGETTDGPGSAGNRRLSEARYQYDSVNRLTETRRGIFDLFTGLPIGDGEAVTGLSYAPAGLLSAETDDNGHTTHYEYDSLHRLTRVTDAAGNVVEYGHDASGNTTSVTLRELPSLGGVEQVFTVGYDYDGLNRRIRVSDNLGNNENWDFDSLNNVVGHRDARTNETVFDYDGLNRLIATTHFEGEKERGITINTSHVEYETQRVRSTTDGNGNVTEYAYDALDRLVRVGNPDGTEVFQGWDARGNLANRIDANGTLVQYAHDLLDRCVRRDITPGVGVSSGTTFEEFDYDGASRLVRAANDGVEHVLIWDSRSELVRQEQTVGGVTLVASATLDGVGNRLSLTHPSGRVMATAYDAIDRPVSVSGVAGGETSELATYAYEGPGRVGRIARANGLNTRVNWDGIEGVPNQPGDLGWRQVSRVNHSAAMGNPVIDRRTYTYDAAQNKTVRALHLPFIQGGPLRTNAWSHDALNRLRTSGFVVGNDPPSVRAYQLDPNGNRQAVVENGRVGSYVMDDMLPEPGDFQMNQYSMSPIGTHHYDGNGSLIGTESMAVLPPPELEQMNYEGQADALGYSEGMATVTVAAYAYDAFGRRVLKTIYLPAPLAPVTTRFFHDFGAGHGGVIEEREGGVVTRSYFIPEVGDEVLVAFNAGGEAQYHHCDELGTMLALTDAEGRVIERYDYDDHGLPVFMDANGNLLTDAVGLPVMESAAGNPVLFRGMYWDPEASRYLCDGEVGPVGLTAPESLRERSYDPQLGRLTSRGSRLGGMEPPGETATTAFGDNPWTMAKKEEGGRHTPFHNKYRPQFLIGAGGGADEAAVIFNPKEYTLRKVLVRGWDPGKKKAIIGKAEDGRRRTPFHKKYRPQRAHRTTDVTGEIELPVGREMMMDGGGWTERVYGPGQAHFGSITIRARFQVAGMRGVGLIVPVAMDKGLRFAIREGGRTVGAGQVTEIVQRVAGGGVGVVYPGDSDMGDYWGRSGGGGSLQDSRKSLLSIIR